MSPRDVNDVGQARWEDSVPYNDPDDRIPLPPQDNEPPPGYDDPPPFDEGYSWDGPGTAVDKTAVSPDLGGNGKPKSIIRSAIIPEVKQLIERHKRISNLWHGKGKTWEVTDENGEKVRLPVTSIGYALSFACALIRKGITNESVIATAIWFRPDESVKLLGEEYILGLIKKALDISKQQEDDEENDSGIDFSVQNFTIYNADPAAYKLEVNGIGIRLSVEELLNPNRFTARYMQRLQRIPKVPYGKEKWRKVINSWLEDAEVIELPPEASTDTMTREVLIDIINKMPTSDKMSDLDLGRVVETDGYQAIKTRPLLKSYCESEDKISTHQLCRHLRALGFDSDVKRDGEKTERVWTRPKNREVVDNKKESEENFDFEQNL